MTKINFKSLIPETFYKEGESRPKPQTVGQLKAILSELPDTLAVRYDSNTPAEVVVANVSTADRFMTIRGVEGY